MHIQISLGTKFPLKLTILIFWTKFTSISSQNEEKRTSPWNYGYLISLSTKFQLKLTILSFLDQIYPKRAQQNQTTSPINYKGLIFLYRKR